MAIRHDPEQAEVAALTALVPSFAGRSVLEIGCGEGRLTRRYAARAASVLAIDPDAQAIAQCRADVPDAHVTFQAIGFEHFTAPPGTYDTIILSWSL